MRRRPYRTTGWPLVTSSGLTRGPGLIAAVRTILRRPSGLSRGYRTTGWPLITSPGLTAVLVLIAVALAANLFFGGNP